LFVFKHTVRCSDGVFGVGAARCVWRLLAVHFCLHWGAVDSCVVLVDELSLLPLILIPTATIKPLWACTVAAK